MEFPGARVAMEVGTHSPWVSRLPEGLGCDVNLIGSVRASPKSPGVRLPSPSTPAFTGHARRHLADHRVTPQIGGALTGREKGGDCLSRPSGAASAFPPDPVVPLRSTTGYLRAVPAIRAELLKEPCRGLGGFHG